MFASNLFAHDKVDSLQRLLDNERNDTARLTLLNEIAWELKVSDPAKAIHLIDSIITLSKIQNIPVCLAEAYNHLGIIMFNICRKKIFMGLWSVL